jgi:hypothetical protein
MSRPLLITDCDEVLLHMVRHFGVWLRESHDVEFDYRGPDMFNAMTRANGERPSTEEMWGFLGGFFPDEMERQTLVPHAREALSEVADIVVLTNLQDNVRDARIAQLDRFGIRHRVVTNQGGKGDPVGRLVAEYGASVAVFVDDLAVHHESVTTHAPHVHRLHMISEPDLAPNVPPAPYANARIDDWREAQAWIADRFAAGLPAS